MTVPRLVAALALICGAQTTKDIRALLRHFAGLAHTVVATPFVGEHKCWPPEDVVAMAKAPRALN